METPPSRAPARQHLPPGAAVPRREGRVAARPWLRLLAGLDPAVGERGAQDAAMGRCGLEQGLVSPATKSIVPCCGTEGRAGTAPRRGRGMDQPITNQAKANRKKPHGSTNNPWTRVIVGEFQGWDFPFPLLRLQAAPSRAAAEGPRTAKHLLQNLKNLE